MRTIEQIRADMTKGNPLCLDCNSPSYKKTFVGSTENYYTCSSNNCFCAFNSNNKKVGLSAFINKVNKLNNLT